MENQNTIENLNCLRKMARANTMLFNMSLSHLFACGTDSFTEEAYTAALISIKEKHMEAAQKGTILFMTLEFEKSLLEMAYQLAKYPLFDIFLYVKKHLDIFDPEVAPPDDDYEDNPQAYTLEQVKELRDIPAWLMVDSERTLVIVSGYEWQQGHVTEWLTFQNHHKLSLDRYKDEWVLYPYHNEI